MQVYKERGWSLAEDHINFTIGRQFFTLGQPDSAVQALREILTNDSRQTAKQQAAFLREYLYVYKVSSPSWTMVHSVHVPRWQAEASMWLATGAWKYSTSFFQTVWKCSSCSPRGAVRSDLLVFKVSLCVL